MNKPKRVHMPNPVIKVGSVWYFTYGPFGTKEAAKEKRDAVARIEIAAQAYPYKKWEQLMNHLKSTTYYED